MGFKSPDAPYITRYLRDSCSQADINAVALTLNDKIVTVGLDKDGHLNELRDDSIQVWAVPDCTQPLYLFVRQWSDGNPGDGTDWVFDVTRSPKPNESALVEFPSLFGPYMVVSVRRNILTVTTDTARRSEKTYQYYPDPVRAFIKKGVQTKYLSVISKPNDDFFENVAASDLVMKAAGKRVFDDLHSATMVGDTKMFGGRYLIVSGFTPHAAATHGAVIVDVVGDTFFLVLCDDWNNDKGQLTATSQARSTEFIETDGDAVLAAFRSAGFILKWDNKNALACDGDCHSHR